jgi:hypothetical protein
MIREVPLSYRKKPIRAVAVEEHLWFSVADVFAMLGEDVQRQRLAHFAPEHLSEYRFQGDEAPQQVTSLLGAQTIAAARPFGVQQRIVYNWLAKQDDQLRLPPDGSRPVAPVTLMVDGSLPPSPGVCSPRYAEWMELNSARRIAMSPLVVVMEKLRETEAAMPDRGNRRGDETRASSPSVFPAIPSQNTPFRRAFRAELHKPRSGHC